MKARRIFSALLLSLGLILLTFATTLAAPPIAPTIPITKTNTVSCSATKTCAAYKPVPQSPAKP